jgi:trans-aconitate 2-methyltransferase
MSLPDARADRSYQFGDSHLAAERLALLAEVFQTSTRAFLVTLAARRPARVLDAGCGPGCTTRLLSDTFSTATVTGVDISPYFVELARQTPHERTSYRVADVSKSLPGESCDLIYCRYLLTHLARPTEVVARWGTCLARSGAIAIEENEWIETQVPAFARYLTIVEAMLADSGQNLYVGAELARSSDWQSVVETSSEIAPVAVDNRRAARMFLMNLATWRLSAFIERTYAAAEIDQLERDLKLLATAEKTHDSITFGQRRLVLERRRP